MTAPAVRMGAVHLSVASLTRSLDYYEHAIGLAVHRREDDRAHLGAGGGDLLVLHEQPGARPADGFCGLFHLALLVPGRDELARWLVHAVRDQVALEGMADHRVSEALYLRDPDGHGIEIYADRPRGDWDGRVAELMTTLPLDTDALVATLPDPARATFAGLPDGTAMGHVHLCVADVETTIPFYRDLLGLELMATFGRRAAFLGSGGYHHHVGANSWASAGAPPPPADRAALRAATIVFADPSERDTAAGRIAAAGQAPEPISQGAIAVEDPSGNRLILETSQEPWPGAACA